MDEMKEWASCLLQNLMAVVEHKQQKTKEQQQPEREKNHFSPKQSFVQLLNEHDRIAVYI